MNSPRNIYDVLYTLVIVGAPVIATIVGIWLGKWLERREKRIDRKVFAYVNAEKVLSKWMKEVTSLSDNALFKMADELEEAKAFIVLAGSYKAITALSDVQQTILDVEDEISRKKTGGNIDPSKGVKQFTNYSKFMDAKNRWINMVRKEIGTKEKIQVD